MCRYLLVVLFCMTSCGLADEFEESENDLDMFVVVPHLEDRELGEPNVDGGGVPVVWDHPLPFFGQEVTELGFELPLPFGISIVPATFEQDLILRDLNLGLQGEADRPIDAINFQNPSVRNTALQLKFDAWLFPFMNVFATVGRVDGRATIPLTVLGSDVLPEQCDRQLGAPDLCDREFSATAKPNYDGTNWSIGTVLAMGWDQFFVVLPIVYAVSDIDLLDTDVTCHTNFYFTQTVFFNPLPNFEGRGPRERNPRAKPDISTLREFRAVCQVLGFGPVFARRRKSCTLQIFRNRLTR